MHIIKVAKLDLFGALFVRGMFSVNLHLQY